MMDDWSRRELLRAGAATAGLGAAGAVAGCSDLTGGSGEEGTDPAGTATPGSETAGDGGIGYGQWLPAPSALGSSDHYYSRYDDYEQIRANESNFDDEVYGRYEDIGAITQLGIRMADIETAITIGPLTPGDPSVLRGEFDVDELRETVTEMGFEEDRALGEYTVYTSASRGGSVAITSDTVLFRDGVDGAVTSLEALVDARNGEADTYADASEDMRELLDRVGDSGTFVSAQTEEQVTQTDPSSAEFEGQIGFGYRDTVTGETTETKIVVLFESPDSVDMDAIERYTEEDFFEDYRDITTTQEGRAVVITTAVDTSDLYAEL